MAIMNLTGVLASNPFFRATKGSSIMLSIRVKSGDGKTTDMNCFLTKTGKPHPWSRFQAGDAVTVEYYTDVFKGKVMNRIRDIQPAEAVETAEVPAETAGVQTTLPGFENAECAIVEDSVRGYVRTLKSGKQVFVRGHIRRRKVAAHA